MACDGWWLIVLLVFVLHRLAILAKVNWDVVWVEWGATDVADFGATGACE